MNLKNLALLVMFMFAACTDVSAASKPKPPSGYRPKTNSVSGYYKKSGTYVAPYKRAPSQKK